MGILQRVFATISGLSVVCALAGCSGSEVSDVLDGPVSVSDALTVPCSAADLGAGTVSFRVTLPAGQHYVEVFARKNGIQNEAHEVVTSGVVNGNGTTTYSYEKSGYQVGDFVEYRFYSYIGPAVFTPGPAQNAWLSFKYGASSTFKTTAGDYLLGPQTDALGRTFSYQLEPSIGATFVTPYSTGWFLTFASPASVQVETDVQAELVGTFVKQAGTEIYAPASSYDASYPITGTQYTHLLDIAVDPDAATYPGLRVDPRYAEGGRSITLDTLIGPQTLTTDAKVTFAHLVKQKSWSDE